MLQCILCGTQFSIDPLISRCEVCGGTVEYILDLSKIKKINFSATQGLWRYRQMLPPVKHIISLGEGGTPLHKAERLAKTMPLKQLYLKDETRSPTNSYRDRAASLLVSNAVDRGFAALVSASNGNMGASLSAYSAKIGIACHVIVPKVVDVGKLAQMLAYDGLIEEYGDTVDESISRAIIVEKETGWYQATAELNPFAVEAQKTAAYEIFEQFGVPDWLIVPMGSGGTIYSLWKGFKELKQLGMTDALPKMVGVQPEGCAPIVNSLSKDGSKQNTCSTTTRALAILVSKPVQCDLASKAIIESKGIALTVLDKEIFTTELQIAKLEGVFAEPASASTVAALQRLTNDGRISYEDSVVCVITSSGLKATDVLQVLTKKQKTAGLGLEISTKEKILRIISQESTYGYDLWIKLGKIMTRAAIYQHLNELTKKGLISGYEENGKRFFRITEKGKRAIAAFDDLKLFMG